MWDVIWFLGLPMFGVGVFGYPSGNYDSDRDSYNSDNNYDTVYDQRQTGTENYQVSVDGLSLVWTSNSLLGAAALLEPALYGDTNFEILLGSNVTATEDVQPNKTSDKPEKSTITSSKPVASTASSTPLVIIDEDHPKKNKSKKSDNESEPSQRKFRISSLLRPFLSKSVIPVKIQF